MNRITSGLILIIVLAISAFSQPSPTLTIINQTEESATVRIVGPTTRNLEVASGARGITSVSGGT